jgi:hypothetical protein
MGSKLKLRDVSQSLGATIDARDVAILAQIAILSSISWLAPQRYWLKLSEDLGALRRLVRRDLAAREAMVGSLLQGRNAAKPPGEIVRMADAYYFLERVQLLRHYRPGGWSSAARLRRTWWGNWKSCFGKISSCRSPPANRRGGPATCPF